MGQSPDGCTLNSCTPKIDDCYTSIVAISWCKLAPSSPQRKIRQAQNRRCGWRFEVCHSGPSKVGWSGHLRISRAWMACCWGQMLGRGGVTLSAPLIEHVFQMIYHLSSPWWQACYSFTSNFIVLSISAIVWLYYIALYCIVLYCGILSYCIALLICIALYCIVM